MNLAGIIIHDNTLHYQITFHSEWTEGSLIEDYRQSIFFQKILPAYLYTFSICYASINIVQDMIL